MSISIEQVREFFRDDESLNSLSMDDRQEIAMSCVAYSNLISDMLNDAIELDNQ